MPNIFSLIVQGQVQCHKVWEDENFLAFLDIHPIQPGMTVVIPKKEVEHPFDMPDDDYCALMLAAKHLVPAIQKVTGSLRVGLVIEGLEVPYAHVKLIPISKPNDLLQANAKVVTFNELVAMAKKIRMNIG
jgi:histidine triad (HIT) family protein